MPENTPQTPPAAGPEPWLSGAHSELHTVARLLCCSLDHSLADLRRWLEPLTKDQVWKLYKDIGSVGFQLRHLAGSVDRLLTYAKAQPLSAEQLVALRSEPEPGAEAAELLESVETAYNQAKEFARITLAAQMEEPRYIGRQRLATTLGLLLGHIAEHTQRHTGQAIVVSKLAARNSLQETRPE